MTYLTALKAAKNRKELAKLLNYQPKSLTAIIYKTPLEAKYSIFEIAKKSGGKREIKAPNEKLKKLQKHLADYLYKCQFEIEEQRNSAPVSFAYRENVSIVDHAKKHKRRRYVFNIDLQDFFPAIHFGRVRGFFLKDFNFLLSEEVATTISQIACDGKALPQGSPCSPIISELVCQIMDLRLLRLAKKYRVTYSRYADDLTFSTNQKDFPKEIAYPDPKNSTKWIVGTKLSEKITGSGFQINLKKTRMQARGSRQEVTGLIINEKVNIKSRYYRQARAMCDSLFQTGSYYKECTIPDSAEEEAKPKLLTSLHPIDGILNHIYTITQCEEKRSLQEQRKEPRAIRELYRRFLFFKHCAALSKPLIITEGKTDSIYLREAIRDRQEQFSTLGTPTPDGFNFKIKFFNYTSRNHEIMDLGGGSGDLKSIPLDYLRNFRKKDGYRKPITFKPMKHPVIMLLDNDNGLAPVASTLKKSFGTKININTTSDFYHIIENLYLIKTPEVGKESCIEDLFPKIWTQRKLNNKTFNKNNSTFDSKTEYSKEVFAKRIVKPNAKEIDFSGFDPLLYRIVAVLKEHDARTKS